MAIQTPTLSLFYEDGKDFRPIRLGTWVFEGYLIGLDSIKSIVHSKSFGILRVVLEGAKSSHFQLLVDGKYAPLTQVGTAWSVSIPLTYDLEFRRISALARPRLALTMDIAVEHMYSFKSLASETNFFSKWSRSTYESELTQLSPMFDNRKQAGVQIETLARGFATVQEDHLPQALLQTCGRLSSRLAGAEPSEMLVDFNRPAEGEIDREGLLTLIKDDPRRLSKSPRGPIHVNGARYTSVVSVRSQAMGTRPNLAPVLSVVQMVEHLLRESSCPAGIIGVLSETAMDIERHCELNGIANVDVSNFLDKPMYSAFGLDVQGLCKQLLLLTSKQLGRDSQDQGIFWLKRTIRDFDVFETAVFACCAKAFGFSESEILSSRAGVLTRTGVTVANANSPGGLQLFKTSITGWRSSSSQPSDFRPDSFVLLSGAHPVLIDAKFRVAPSVDMLVHPDGAKDVQAYLDDFGLNGAVIVVPRIINQAMCVSPGLGLIQSTDKYGRHRMIAVVEMQRSNELLALDNIKKAVERIATTASS